MRPGASPTPGSGPQPAGTRAASARPQASPSTRAAPCCVADRGNERVAQLWGDGTFLGEIGGPAALGGAQLSGAGSVAVSTGPDEIVRRRQRPTTACWSTAPKAACGLAGEPAAETEPPAAASGEFNHPAAVAADAAGTVYVADTGNNRVVELNADGTVLRTWGSRGTGEGRFHSPNGIALDGAGDVYVLDGENNRVQVFDPNGRFLARFGNRGIGLGQLSQPGAIAVDCNGAVYVADTNNNRIERFNLAAPNPAGCLAPGSWPPPLDVAPVLTVRLPRAGGILARRALALDVSCRRGCKILASATLSALGGRGRGVPLIAAARGLPPARAGHVRLRVGPRGLHRLRRQLGRRTAMRARVTIVAAGPTGRRTTVVRSFIVRR